MRFRNYTSYEIDVENGKVINKFGRPIGRTNHLGYIVVGLRRGKNIKQFMAHRVIWETAYGKIPYGCDIHHKDGDKTNNKLSNLELVNWYQHVNSHHNNRNVEAIIDQRSRSVIQMTLDGCVICEYPSLYATRKNGYCVSSVSRCCNGINRTHKGFLWKFKEN